MKNEQANEKAIREALDMVRNEIALRHEEIEHPRQGKENELVMFALDREDGMLLQLLRS